MGMYRVALAALMVVAACGGNPFIPEVVEPVVPVDPNAPVVPVPGKGAVGVIQRLQKNGEDLALRDFAYDGTTLSIDMAGVSSSGQYGTFIRKPSMDIPRHYSQPKYLAYEFQQTNMTRSYLAYVAENQRGNLLAIASSDGGQFNKHNAGAG